MPQAFAVAAIASLIAANVAVNYAISLLTTSKKDNDEARPSVEQNGHLINTRSPSDPYKVIYGPFKVGGNQPYISTTGDNNEKLHIIQTICEGEIDGLDEEDPIQLDGTPIADFGSDASYEFFNGSDTQGVCQTLHAADPNWNDARRGTAYVYIQLNYNPAKFSGMPDSITVKGRGRKVYDPETGLTAYSTNHALCYYDLVRNTRFGAGIAAEFWDEDSIIDSKHWCDDQGFTCSAIISDQEPAIDISEKFLAGMRHATTPIWSGGLYRILPLDYDAPVISLGESDIKADSWSFGPPSIQNLYNTCNLTFIDADNDYVSNTLPVPDSSALLLDNGDERTLDIQIINSTDRVHCQKIGTFLLNRARIDRSHTFIAGRKAIPLEPGDIISVTHSFPGWTEQRARVTGMTIMSKYEVSLTVEEEYPELYPGEINMTESVQYNTNLPDPLAVPPEIIDIVISEEQIVIKDNSATRVKIAWEPATGYPFLDYVEVWVSYDDGVNYSHYTDTAGETSIEPLKDGQALRIKLRPVNISGRKDDLAKITAHAYTVQGKTEEPPDVTGFKGFAVSDNVYLRWNAVSAEDLLGYEIRVGSIWENSIFFAFTKSIAWPIVGLRPDTHNFLIKAKDTLGNYSVNAAGCQVTSFAPANYTEKHSFEIDYTTGTHNHTELYNDPVNGYVLRVQHDISPISGSVTLANMRCSFADGCAFADFLASGVLTDNLAKKLVITSNTTGKKATGYTKAAGAGEIYGDELIINGDDWVGASGTTPPNGWTKDSPAEGIHTIFDSGDGVPYDKCLKLAVDEVPNTNPNIMQHMTVAIGKLYKTTFAFKHGDGTTGRIDIGNTVWGSEYKVFNDLVDAVWTIYTHVLTATTIVLSIRVLTLSGVAGKYELFDTISVKQILAPSVTGVTIVSAPGGETQSWESIEEGFNFNDAAGYTYDIYEIPSTTLTGDYTSAVQNMGSIKTVRHWGEFDLIFNNVAASWEGEFSAGNTWADKLESSDTWLSKFVGAIAGDISIRLWYSEDNITWNYIDDFQLLSCEITAQYVQYQIFLTDNDANSYIYVKSPFTGKAYYWQ